MNLTHKILITIGLIMLFASCKKDEFGPLKESTPVIESASISPSDIVFGDSVVLMAKISDPKTNLYTLAYEIVVDERLLASGEIPIDGSMSEVAHPIYVPLLHSIQDNADVEVNLIAWNVLKGAAIHQITGLKGKRPQYDQLYLVTEDGSVATLLPESGDMNRFYVDGLTLDSYFNYRIAEKLHEDKTIDYSGDVYGNVDGQLGLIGESGEGAFAYSADADYTQEFLFDAFALQAACKGSALGEDDFSLSRFASETIEGELFRVSDFYLEKGKTYSLFGELAHGDNIYNLDFFERTAENKVLFLGETGDYTVYYNPVRKNVIVGVDNPSYPDYLLACGWGLGYPTKVSSDEIALVYPNRRITHTDWGFDHVLKYVLLRRVEDNVFQGTFYTPADHDHYAGFKPFENTGWGNEKPAGMFTFTGEQIIQGDNNWTIPNDDENSIVESGVYRFTINLNDNTVHIEKVVL